MTDVPQVSGFGYLFKKYRLRSEIETLAEFGDLLADEGYIYETSLFTRWQKGERIPRDRDVLLAILKVFVIRKGIVNIQEANSFVESANQRRLVPEEIFGFSTLIETYSTTALQISLGNIIRDFRTQKGITYAEVALGMGWADQSTIESIENGKIDKPSRESIDKLCEVLGLKLNEKNRILYVGGYLPTTKEIDEIRKCSYGILEGWQYPSVLIDFSWRIIAENSHSRTLYNYTDEVQEYIYLNTPTIVEAQFSPELSIISKLSKEDSAEYKEMLVQMLLQFRLVSHSWRSEEWYQKLLTKMHTNELFRECWQKSSTAKPNKITKAGIKVFPHPKYHKKLTLEFVVVPLIHDPRFEIEYLFPSDDFTYRYFNAISKVNEAIKNKT